MSFIEVLEDLLNQAGYPVDSISNDGRLVLTRLVRKGDEVKTVVTHITIKEWRAGQDR